MPTGVVKGREVKKNRDGEANVLIIQAEISDPDDLQSVELVTQSGEDYNPRDGAKIVIVKIGEAFQVAIACDDGIVPVVNPGERRMYSLDSAGAVAAVVYLKADGQAQINGGSGTAVEFARLKTAFDQLKSDFDALVSDYNAHGHGIPPINDSTAAPCVLGPPGVAIGNAIGMIAPITDPNGQNTTADIDPAESATVEIP